MGDNKIMNSYIREQSRSSEEEEDRLSSLPDDILTNILSRLTIRSAGATSVLSHRWRHVWTGITCVIAYSETRQLDSILRQLTSRKLHKFDLDVRYQLRTRDMSASETESWVREICSRNVEDISIQVDFNDSFTVPAAILFNSQSLVTLELGGPDFERPEIGDLCCHLPNLMSLTLCWVGRIGAGPLETLLRSCPLLKHLYLSIDWTLSNSVVNIFAPNLISLRIDTLYHPRQIRVSIDAPKLTDLDIDDFYSTYYFLRNPTTLVKACMQLIYDDGYGVDSDDEEEDEQDYGLLSGPREEYLHQMTKFVGGMSSVTNLELKLECLTNIFRYQNPVKLPIFSNVAHLKTNFFKDLMFSLHCFPNLEHLNVSLDCDDKMEQNSWCTPDSISDCLISKLKTIKIWRLEGTDDDLRLLGYILRNAVVMEKLCVDFHTAHMVYHMVDGEYVTNEREKAYAMLKECQLCRTLFKLPRSSSTCEVVVSGRYVRASGNALQGGYLTCRMYVGS